MKRWLINTLAAVSLLLFVLTAVIWIRSYFCIDSIATLHTSLEHQQDEKDGTTETIRRGPNYEADSQDGVLRLLYLYNNGDYYRSYYDLWISFPENDGSIAQWTSHSLAGFAWERQPVTSISVHGPTLWKPPTVRPAAYVVYALYTPFWFWALLFSLPTGSRLFILRRSFLRRRMGCCQSCGYDVRATPDHCPECGAVKSDPIAAGRSVINRRK